MDLFICTTALVAVQYSKQPMHCNLFLQLLQIRLVVQVLRNANIAMLRLIVKKSCESINVLRIIHICNDFHTEYSSIILGEKRTRSGLPVSKN
jgi:hypothetical protein